MDVRYKELFALPERQYGVGAPVILEKAAQVFDQLTGRVYVRILLRSIGQKPLSEVAVTVHWQDGEAQHHTWENPEGPLLIPAPYREGHPFALTVCRVVTSQEVWQGEGALWQPLPEPALLETVLSPEQAAQYRESCGAACKWVPERWEDLYLCSCGAVSKGEPCGVCGKHTPMLTPDVLQDLEDMIAERREREQREREEALARQLREQEARRLQQEKAKRQKRARRMRILRNMAIAAAGLACLLVLAAVGFYHVTRIAIPRDHYEKALAALEQGNYQEAHRQFTLAGKYQDAEEYLARFSALSVMEISRNAKNGYDLSHTYDHRGLLLDYTMVHWKDNGQGSMEKTSEDSWSYVYDDNGNCVEYWNGEYLVERSTYDDRNSLLTRDYFSYDGQQTDARVCSHQYDEAGRVVLSVEVHTFKGNEDLNKTVTKTFSYNGDGSVARQETLEIYQNDTQMNNRESESWIYGADGQVAQYIASYTFANEPRWNRTNKETFSYDTEGRVILKTEETVHHPQSYMRDCVITYRTEYNENGDVIRKETARCYPDAPKENSTETYSATYDREGNLLEEKEESTYADTETHLSLGWTKTKRCEYDLLGRLTKKRESIRYPAGSDRQKHTWDVTTVYTYDSEGMLEKTVEKDRYADPERSDRQIITTYNDNGLPETICTVTDNEENVREQSYAYFYYPEGNPGYSG